MALIIFVITQAKRAQSEICLALKDSEFHGLFKNADSLNHKHFLDNEKDQTNLETFFLGHPVVADTSPQHKQTNKQQSKMR